MKKNYSVASFQEHALKTLDPRSQRASFLPNPNHLAKLSLGLLRQNKFQDGGYSQLRTLSSTRKQKTYSQREPTDSKTQKKKDFQHLPELSSTKRITNLRLIDIQEKAHQNIKARESLSKPVSYRMLEDLLKVSTSPKMMKSTSMSQFANGSQPKVYSSLESSPSQFISQDAILLKQKQVSAMLNPSPLPYSGSSSRRDLLQPRTHHYYEKSTSPKNNLKLSKSEQQLSVFTQFQNQCAANDLIRLQIVGGNADQVEMERVSSASTQLRNIKRQYNALNHRLNNLVDHKELLEPKRTYEIQLPVLKTPFSAKIEPKNMQNPLVISIKRKQDPQARDKYLVRVNQPPYKVVIYDNLGGGELKDREPIFSEVNPDKITLTDAKQGKPFNTSVYVLYFFSMGRECSISLSYLAGQDYLLLAKNDPRSLSSKQTSSNHPLSQEARHTEQDVDSVEPQVEKKQETSIKRVNFMKRNQDMARVFSQYKRMKIREQHELYEWRKDCVEKKRGQEYEKEIRKKMFYMKRWELLKEEKKKHSAELIKEHNKRRMMEEWARFIKIGMFWFDFKKCFNKEVSKAEQKRKKETSANLIRLKWRVFLRNKFKFSVRSLAPLFPMRNIKCFIACLYNQPKRQRAGTIIHSYLLENAARANIFESFVKYCLRASVIQRKWREKLKRYSKVFNALEHIWSSERGKMMKEFVKQRKSKIKKESSLVTMISDQVKDAVLTQYLRACRVRWVRAFKTWYHENEKTENHKRNTIYSVNSESESLKKEQEKQDKKQIALDYKRAGDDCVRSFESLGLNATRLQKIMTQGYKKTMNINSTLILPSVPDPPQVRRQSQFATSLKNNLSVQQRSTSVMAVVNQNIKQSPKKLEKSVQNQPSSKKSSSLAPISRLSSTRASRPSLMSSELGLISGMPRGPGESKFKRGNDNEKKEAINSGDEGENDQIYRPTKDEKGGIALLIKDRAPQLIWRPSQSLTRDLVKIASRIQSPEEAYQAFKP